MSLRCRKVISMLVAALTACIFYPGRAIASRPFAIGPGQDVIGAPVQSVVRKDDTLLDIARDYDLGYNAIVAANPSIDPWLPEAGEKILTPTVWVLPGAKRDGIVVNLAEMRLFYFYRSGGSEMVVTYPIGVGQEGFNTPLGEFRVTGKEKDPTWYPPPDIRQAKPDLPEAVPPGPDNPLGKYKLALSVPGEYRIHGTNKPWGVGRRVSHGCIRLYPEDIERLYKKVETGTRVEIVYQPVKVGLFRGRVYVEAHKDYLGGFYPFIGARAELEKRGLLKLVDKGLLEKALEDRSGVPMDVTR